MNLSALQILESQCNDSEDDDGHTHTHTHKYRACRLTVAMETHAAGQLVEALLLLFIRPLLAER